MPSGPELAVAYVSISASTRGLGKQIVGATDQAAGKASRSFGSKFAAGVKHALGTAAKVGLVGAGAAAGVALVGGFKSAIDQQTSKKVLTGLYGSAKQATKMMDDLRKVSSKSPIDYTTYTKAAGSLAYAGVKGKDAVKTLKNVGLAITASGGSSQNLNQATDAILGMVNAGKVQLYTLNQLSKTGTPIYSGLAKHFGKSIEQVRKMATAGKIKLADVMSVMKDGTGKTFQTMIKAGKKASESFGNVFKRVKDNIFTTIGAALVPALDKMTPLLAKAGDAVTNFIDGMQSGKGAGGKFVAVLDGVWHGAKSLYDLLVKGDFTSAFRKAFNVEEDSKIVGFLLKVRTSVKEAFGYLVDTIIPAVTSGFSQIGRAAAPMLPALVKIGKALLPLFKSAGTSARNSGPGILAAAFGLLRGAVSGMAAILTGVADFATKHGTAFRTMAVSILAAVAAWKASKLVLSAYNVVLTKGKAAVAAYQGVTAVLGKMCIGTRIQLAALKVQTIAQTVASKVAMVATKAWAAGQRILNAVMRANPIGLVITALVLLGTGLVLAYKKSETFRKIVNAAFSGIKKVASAVLGWLTGSVIPFFTKTLPNAFHATVNWVKKNWPKILAILTGPIGLATLAIIKNWDKITGAFKAAWRWVKGTFKRSWNGLKNIVLHPVQAAKDTIKAILGPQGAIRSAFRYALVGIGSIWSGLKNKLSAPITTALNWIKKHFVNPIAGLLDKIGLDGLAAKLRSFAGGGIVGYSVKGVTHLAGGGSVPGPWKGPKADNVLGVSSSGIPTARVNPGEYITNVASTNKMRRNHPGELEYINRYGRLSGYAGGGLLSPYSGKSRASLVKFGRLLQSQGYQVGENPSFGGVHPVHTKNSFHYKDAAIDVNHDQGMETLFLAKAVQEGLQRGFAAHWQSPGHFDHAHFDIGTYSRIGGKLSRIKGGKAMQGSADLVPTGPPGWLVGKLRGLRSKITGWGSSGGMWQQMIGSLGGRAASGVIKKVSDFFLSGNATGGAGGGSAGAGVAGAKSFAKARLAAFGWGPGQFAPLESLWNRESGWRWNAKNASSGAYGIPQALPGSKMASAGADWRTNKATQITWGEKYIKSRYGSPAAAWAHSQRNGWYANGGVVAPVLSRDRGGVIPPGLSTIYNGTGRNEWALTHQQAQQVGGGTLKSGDTVILSVGEREFTAYVDSRARGQIANSGRRAGISR